jgi:hypothetical protein
MAILMTIGMPNRGIIPPKLPGRYIRHIMYWLHSWQMCQRCSLSLFLLLETFFVTLPSSVLIPSTIVVETGLYKSQTTSWYNLHSVSRILELVFVCVGWSALKVILILCKKKSRTPLILNLNTRWRWVVGLIPPWPSTRGKRQRCPLARTKELSGRCGKQKPRSSAGHGTRIAEPFELSPSYC